MKMYFSKRLYRRKAGIAKAKQLDRIAAINKNKRYVVGPMLKEDRKRANKVVRNTAVLPSGKGGYRKLG